MRGGETKYQYNWAIIGPPTECRHLNGANDGQLVSFVIFQGIWISIAKKPCIFVFFQRGPGPTPPSGSVHVRKTVTILRKKSFLTLTYNLFQLKMWETFNREFIKETTKSKAPTDEEPKLPEWLEKYIEYKFNLLDRTGNVPIHWLSRYFNWLTTYNRLE